MSHPLNDIYLEEVRERFMEILSDKRWHEVQSLYIELEENGFGDKVPALSQLMTGEECQEYRRWDAQVNGSTETQMDDDSDTQ